MNQFLLQRDRMISLGILAKEDVEGCTEDDIKIIENTNKIHLPKTYTDFLRVFGRRVGGPSKLSDICVTYELILDKTSELKMFLSGLNIALAEGWIKGEGSLAKLHVPQSIFVIMSNANGFYHFIYCNKKEVDPPVFSFDSDVTCDSHFFFRENFKMEYESVSEWVSHFILNLPQELN